MPVLATTTQRKQHRSYGPWCWACHDCNTKISSRYFDTFKARCEWQRDRLNRKALAITWHQEEIEGLNYELRTYVAKEVARLKWLRYRADWFQSREYYLGLESLIWKVREIKPVSAGNCFVLSFFAETLSDLAQLYRPKSLDRW